MSVFGKKTDIFFALVTLSSIGIVLHYFKSGDYLLGWVVGSSILGIGGWITYCMAERNEKKGGLKA